MAQYIHFCFGEIALKNFIEPRTFYHPGTHLIFYQGPSLSYKPQSHITVLPNYIRFKYTSIHELVFFIPSFFFFVFLFLRYRGSIVVSHMSLNSPIILLCSYISKIKNVFILIMVCLTLAISVMPGIYSRFRVLYLFFY